MSKYIDLTNKRFGRLLVKSISKRKNHRIFWSCKCDCGNSTEVCSNVLRRGSSKSCGCLSHELSIINHTIHGLRFNPLYKTWLNMMKRCYNPNHKNFPLWGGRGIKVCKRWHNVANFVKDMKKRPYKHLLDRIDNNKGYSPSNCRWASYKISQDNRRCTIWLEFKNKRHTLKEWSDLLGIDYHTLYARIVTRKWTIEEALETPVGGLKK